jgi:mannosidase alpha-like ER degradation enhancer 2
MKALRALAVTLFCGTSLAVVDPVTTTDDLDPAAQAERVRGELLHAWKGYERHAWGHDALRPLSRSPHDWYGEPLLMTPVDSLDTLLILGFPEEAEKARKLIVENLSFDRDLEVQVFEVTIRLLGGLLSGHQMTGDERLLALAADLGTRLLPAFDSPTGMPYRFVNLRTGKTSGNRSNPAEIGTLILEFGTLAKLTGKDVFLDRAKEALRQLHGRRSGIGLVGDGIDVETGEWTGKNSHVGGGIDSYYEYLLKCARLFGDRECKTMWRQARGPMHRYLADEVPSGLWYGEAEMDSGLRTGTRYGALHAFLPAVLVLDGDRKRAALLQESGFKMWTLTGIEPELLDFRSMKIVSPGYQLRPEIVESAYYLFQGTGDAKYRDMGRVFLDDLIAYCRTEDGYAALENVETREKRDSMPSYFLAETLKYLYLLFAPDAVNFDEVTFNTEAHPLRRTW